MAEALENTTATESICLVSDQLRVADNEAQPTSRQTNGKEHSMRIVLVHDDAIVRVDIRELLSRMPGIEVVGQYAGCDQVLTLIKQLRPDLVLLHITAPGRSGLDALQSLRRRIPDVPVLVLTMPQAREYAVQLLRAGAAAHLPKSAAITELEKAIRTVAQGEKYVWDEIAHEAQLIINEERLLHSLTSRQRQVLTLIAQGYNTKRIALALNISIKTVESHRAQLMERLRIHDVGSGALCDSNGPGKSRRALNGGGSSTMTDDLKRVCAKAERLAQLAYRIAEIIVDLQKRAQDDSKMTTFCREI